MRSRISRRDFLLLSAAGSASIALACGDRSPSTPTPSPSPVSSPPPPSPPAPFSGTVLDAAEWRAIDALSERILPATTTTAGAREAQVVVYIDRQLATPMISPIAKGMKLAAQLLDLHATSRFGAKLADLPGAQQDAIVDDLARGRIPTKVAFPQREVFRVAHMLTLEGYLSDPHHGGNANMVGWKAIDFPEPHLRRPGGDHGHGHH